MTINEQIDEIVELQPEETKAVVGGAIAVAAAAGAEMRRMEPAMRVEMAKMPAPHGELAAVAAARVK